MKYHISGIILAGGVNSRFNGITKANIVIGGKTIISRIIDTIRDIFDEIIIVTNTPEEFTGYSGVKIVSDHFLKAGPLGGIHAALKASSMEESFIFAGDMPLINSKLIRRQIEYFRSNKCDILIPQISSNIEPLHAIYTNSIFRTLEEYLAGGNDKAVREFYKLLNVSYLQFESSEEIINAFTNINLPSDVSKIEKILGLPNDRQELAD